MSVEIAIIVLLVLGLAFMMLEAITPSFGLLGLGGAVSFFAALSMLHEIGSLYGVPVGMPVLIAAGLIGLAVLAGSFYFVYVAHKSRIAAGAETMVGMNAKVLHWTGTRGQVHIDGEEWAAQGPEGLAPGDIVTVAQRDNLILTVHKG